MRAQNIAMLLLSFCFLLLFTEVVSAEKQKIISEINEYGGKSIEITKEKGDSGFDATLREILSNDSNGIALKKEVFYTDEFARENGHVREIDYYSGNGKTTKMEYFYPDKLANEEGYYRQIDYYDINGKMIFKYSNIRMNARMIQ